MNGYSPAHAGARLLFLFLWIAAGRILLEFGSGGCCVYACLLLIVAFVLASRRAPLTSHGRAAWATGREIAAAGLLAGGGVVLGRDERGRLLTTPPWAVHTLVVAPTGAGKNIYIIAPTLLSHRTGGLIVFDFKDGENFTLFAAAREAMGRKVHRIDVFHAVLEGVPARFNPLGHLRPDASLVDAARMIATAIVVREPHETQPFFNSMAVVTLTFIIVFVVCCWSDEERNIGMVGSLARNSAALTQAVATGLTSDAAGGGLKELAGSVSMLLGAGGPKPTEFFSVMSTVGTHLSAFESAVVKEALSETTLDLEGLRRGDLDLFLVMPASKLESHQAVMRLVITALVQHLIANRDGAGVLILADELPQLTKLPVFKAALVLLRSYGVKLCCFAQSLSQLPAVFDAPDIHGILSNFDAQLYFGVNDIVTAQAIHQRLGASTILVASHQENGSSGVSADGFGTTTGANRSHGWSVSHSPHERALVRPEEAFLLEGLGLILLRNKPPVLSRLIRYTDPAFAPVISRGNHRLVLAALVVLCILLWLLARPERQDGGSLPEGGSATEPVPRWAAPR